MRVEELDFHLPPELIAQEPSPAREAARLLHYSRSTRSVTHRHVSDLPSILRRGDLLVFNDARVIPARFFLRKSSGGRIEGLFLEELQPGRWRVMLKNLGSFRGALHFPGHEQCTAHVLSQDQSGQYEIELMPAVPALGLLERIGRMPLPPYIHRDRDHDARDQMDRQRYQTVFARNEGAVAAPTASLHFSQALLDSLCQAGIEITCVTLLIGAGTFKPVETVTLEQHRMHVERYSIGLEAAAALNRARSERRRIIAVGTTSARVVESQPADTPFVARSDQSGIFIYPPYQWKHVSALITNFHLPRSTLIALVAAMVGLDEQRRLYRIAIEQRYRFFSYGDAMLLE